ncbi:GGDEF domain-containing protein [Alkaliphilus pronyensis]|nr:GGDEF domain-containing protein [Alkaliphilus pronyensis]
MGQDILKALDNTHCDDIINNECIDNVFQCIISLKDGSVLGYEALCRGPKETAYEKPQSLFEMAKENGKIFELEKICKKKAIEKFKSKGEQLKLFVNIDPGCFLKEEEGINLLDDLFMSWAKDFCYVIFEVTEKTGIHDYKRFNNVISKYKKSGISISVDDVSNGYAGINMLSNLEPLYMKINMELVRDIHKEPFKKTVIKSLVVIANNSNSKLIAEGIETKDELDVLIDLGVHYGQGYYIQKPSYELLYTHSNIKHYILERNSIKSDIRIQNITTTKIGEISRSITNVSSNTVGREVNMLFDKESGIQGIPVVDKDKPVGLIMKHKFYRYLGRQYGYSIYMDRAIEILMDNTPLIIDFDTPLDQVTKIAMLRDDDTLYDYIIVTKNNTYYGIATIKDLLEKTTEIELNRAKYANPLTGLPGNIIIEQKISNIIKSTEDYSVLYFDIDNFKSYNDVYGFDNGDRIIEMLGNLIQQCMSLYEFEKGFLGHIGGDDFVAIVESHTINKLCETIIDRFDKSILHYYSEIDQKKGYIMAENRHGTIEQFPLMSISIAVVNNKNRCFASASQLAEYASKIKKKCKIRWTSNYIIGDITE